MAKESRRHRHGEQEVREMRHAETVVRVIQVKHLDVCHWRAV